VTPEAVKDTSVRTSKDVEALFGRLGLSSATYRNFESQVPAPRVKQVAKALESRLSLSPAPLSPPAASRRSSWDTLVSLPTSQRKTKAAKVGLLSLAGGSGKSTISVHLARHLAEHSMPCTLVSCGDRFTLQYFLRNSSPLFGVLSFLHAPAGRSGLPVSVIEAPLHACLRDSGGQVYSLIQQAIADYSTIIFDIPWSGEGTSCDLLLEMDRILVPITPDPRCVASVAALDAFLGGGQYDRSCVQYVLNRYDDSRAMHRQVESRLKALLGSRLLPVVISEEPLMDEALSRGLTVSDYAPECSAAVELDALARWLSSQFSGAPLVQTRAAGGVA
jgi:cellulose biosynthesis protein BcsQ